MGSDEPVKFLSTDFSGQFVVGFGFCVSKHRKLLKFNIFGSQIIGLSTNILAPFFDLLTISSKTKSPGKEKFKEAYNGKSTIHRASAKSSGKLSD